MVVSQLVLATGLLLSGVAGREDACRVERRVVCNLLAMLSYTGHLASLAWWSVAASSLLVSVRQQLSSQLLQTLIWGSVIIACIATFTGQGVEVETVTGLCQMKEQFMSSQIPSAIFLIISILLLVTGGCAVLAWLEAACAPTRSHVASFCLCLATCLQASWLVHTGVALLSQVN